MPLLLQLAFHKEHIMNLIMIIIVIFIGCYLADKGEHITLYMNKQNVYIILQNDICTHIVIYSHGTHIYTYTHTLARQAHRRSATGMKYFLNSDN